MSQLLCPTDQLLAIADDKFIVNNMLTDDDLGMCCLNHTFPSPLRHVSHVCFAVVWIRLSDLDLDPCVWADLLSNDSNSCDSMITQMMDTTTAALSVTADATQTIQTPETPPSSDRSTPPNFDDLLTTTQTAVRTTHNHLFIPNGTSLSPQSLPNGVALIPAINWCPMSPLSPILPSQTPLLTIKTESEMFVINNTLNNNCVNHMNANCVAKRTTTSSSAVATNAKTQSSVELSQQRREARKLRNREAATISRKRQKEYVFSLENSIKGLVKENSDLKSENQALKQRLQEVEDKYHAITRKGYNYGPIESACKCRQQLLAVSSGSNKKATISLLAVIFMLGLNLAPFGGIGITSDKTLSAIESDARLDSTVRHGPSRALLWNPSDDNLDIDVMAFNTSARNDSVLSDIKCKSYINQTESRRLATDLRDWVSRVEMEKEEVFRLKRRVVKANEKPPKSRFDKPIPLSRLKAWIEKRTETDFNDFYDYSMDTNRKGLKVPQIGFDDLLAAIHRRDDTFYLFSYSSKDHLIIPPVWHNTSTGDIRPRFSLLMPLISTLNESTIRGTNITYNQISIMQIDCNVINTKMVLFNTKTGSASGADRQRLSAVKNRTKYALNSRDNTNRTSISAKNSTRN
jgi:hypothetical protein